MKTNEIRELSIKEINENIEKTKKEIFNLRMKLSTGALEGTHKINELRKSVARMKTILTEKEQNNGK